VPIICSDHGDWLLGFIPDDWLHSLDYTTQEKIPGSYITDDLRDRADIAPPHVHDNVSRHARH